MDPNANLKEQREILYRINDLTGDSEYDSDDLLRLAELVTDLDEWISKGGMLPKLWLGSCAVPRVIHVDPDPKRQFQDDYIPFTPVKIVAGEGLMDEVSVIEKKPCCDNPHLDVTNECGTCGWFPQ